MDILLLAVRITIRLMMAVVKGAMWMGKHGTPEARKAGERFSTSVNMSWYPFPFGHLAFEMVVIWGILAVMIGSLLARSPAGGLFVGLLVLPLFYGFGQGVKKPEISGDVPLVIEGKRAIAAPILPALDPLEVKQPISDPILSPQASADRATEADVEARAVGASSYSDLLPVAVSDTGLAGVGAISTDDTWPLLMEAPEILVHAIMSLGSIDPVQFFQETAASARFLATAQEYSSNELIQSASKWADFSKVKETARDDLPTLAVQHCRQVRVALAQGYDSRVGAEFREWLLQLAYKVASSAAETSGGSRISEAEERLLFELADALDTQLQLPD